LSPSMTDRRSLLSTNTRVKASLLTRALNMVSAMPLCVDFTAAAPRPARPTLIVLGRPRDSEALRFELSVLSAYGRCAGTVIQTGQTHAL
jgi:hypothetical protein